MSLNANVLAAIGSWLKADLAIDDRGFGMLTGAAGVAGAVGAFVLGPLVDRFGRRPPLLIGVAVFVVASVGYLVTDSLEALLVVRLLSGFAAGVVTSSAAAAVADLVPYERRSAAMGIVTGAILLAVPVGMPIANLLASYSSWRLVFALQIVCALGAVPAIWFALPRGLGRSDGAWRAAVGILRRRDVLAALLSVALYTGAFFAATQFVADWLHGTRLLDRDRHWIVWILLGVFAALGSFLFGRLADHTGKRRFVLVATLVVGVGLAVLGQCGTPLAFAAVGMPIAAVSAARSAALLALLSELVPPQGRGTIMGLRAAANNLGTGTVPLLAGIIVQSRGFPAFLLVAGGLCVLAHLLVWRFVADDRAAGQR
ncbi:MAG: MFS transporter [Planctomycetes bacterium]|nr:MFS transporter [Planctomycetota bacterium]